MTIASLTPRIQICPVLPHGAATLSSVTVLQKATQVCSRMQRVNHHSLHMKRQSLVTVLINVTVTNATAAGEYELRLIPASTMQSTDVEMPKYCPPPPLASSSQVVLITLNCLQVQCWLVCRSALLQVGIQCHFFPV